MGSEAERSATNTKTAQRSVDRWAVDKLQQECGD